MAEQQSSSVQQSTPGSMAEPLLSGASPPPTAPPSSATTPSSSRPRSSSASSADLTPAHSLGLDGHTPRTGPPLRVGGRATGSRRASRTDDDAVTFEIRCCKPTRTGVCAPKTIFYFSVLAAVFTLGALSVALLAWMERYRGCSEPGFTCGELWHITKRASSRFSTGIPTVLRYIAYLCLFAGPVVQLVLRELTEPEPFRAMCIVGGAWPCGRVSAVVLLWSVAMVCMDVGGLDQRLDSFDQIATRGGGGGGAPTALPCCDTARSLRLWMYLCQIAYVVLVWLGFVWLVGRSATQMYENGQPVGTGQRMPAFFHG